QNSFGGHLRGLFPEGLDEAEVQDLEDVKVEPETTHVKVVRLDVAMEQSGRVCLTERATSLTKHVHRAFRCHRAESLDQRPEVNAGQQLHHEVEAACFADAEIVETYGVRRAQSGNASRFETETLGRRFPVFFTQ